MKSKVIKIAAAAILIVIGIGLIFNSNQKQSEVIEQFDGAQLVQLKDGSSIQLYENAKIKSLMSSKIRHIELLAGKIDVDVAKQKIPFTVKTQFGEVKALGTKFSMELLNSVLENTRENLEMLSVKVTEGTVQVSNEKGSVVIGKDQTINVEKTKAPYDFTQDKSLPPRLIEQIQAMLDAVKAGDKIAYCKNYNIKALFDLGKGNIQDPKNHPWFSRFSEEKIEQLKNLASNVNTTDELVTLMSSGINLDAQGSICYIRYVKIDADAKHAEVQCIESKEPNRYTLHSPVWTYYDNDWWQTND